MVPTAMQMERPDRWLLNVIKTGRTHNTRHEANGYEQAGHQGKETRCPAGRWTAMHKAEHVIHETPYGDEFSQL